MRRSSKLGRRSGGRAGRRRRSRFRRRAQIRAKAGAASVRRRRPQPIRRPARSQAPTTALIEMFNDDVGDDQFAQSTQHADRHPAARHTDHQTDLRPARVAPPQGHRRDRAGRPEQSPRNPPSSIGPSFRIDSNWRLKRFDSRRVNVANSEGYQTCGRRRHNGSGNGAEARKVATTPRGADGRHGPLERRRGLGAANNQEGAERGPSCGDEIPGSLDLADAVGSRRTGRRRGGIEIIGGGMAQKVLRHHVQQRQGSRWLPPLTTTLKGRQKTVAPRHRHQPPQGGPARRSGTPATPSEATPKTRDTNNACPGGLYRRGSMGYRPRGRRRRALDRGGDEAGSRPRRGRSLRPGAKSARRSRGPKHSIILARVSPACRDI